MRNRFQFLLPILDYLGALLWTSGFVLLAPLVPLFVYHRMGRREVSPFCYLVPAVIALALGLVLKRSRSFRPLTSRGAMLLCVLGWIVVSAVGALPFCLAGVANYLDAYFEAVSGFTTTGITMLQGLDELPPSILFWRALTQWMGGLGILAFFLAVVQSVGSAHVLFRAESHKIFSKRPAPGLFHTLKILWTIYAAYTAAIALLLALEGMPVFDAICHSMTALSTGGYSPHDASIGYYAQHPAQFPHYVLMEYTVILGMILGGLNFFIHYRVLTGGVRALWDNAESRLFWCFLAGAAVLVMTDVAVDEYGRVGLGELPETFRHSLFQVVSIMTTTGFGTKDLAAGSDGTYYFPALARQVFLVLMVIGGCVGSTGGGIKVLRIGLLLRMVGRQIKRVVHGRMSVHLVTVDGDRIELEELRRVAALFFAWVVLLFIGGCITAFLSRHGPLPSASGMFSALGNIGPCYISAADLTELHPLIKLTYILGMLAGRLEILPVLILFSRRTWR
jgi:trk system potassium uptake protein TrkH